MEMKSCFVSVVFFGLVFCHIGSSQSIGGYNGPVYVGQQMRPMNPSYVQPAYFVPYRQDYVVQPATGFNNTGTCTFDPRCFQYSEGCTFINCRPFNRTTPVSCEDCMNLCLSQQTSAGPYCCRAAVYDCQYRTCDLFAQDIGGNVANLAKSPGHIYFQPTGQCQAAAPATTPAPLPAICPTGQTEKMVAVKDFQLPGFTGQTIPNITDATACARACINNKLGDGTPIACKSAQFANGQCTVSASQAVAEGSVVPAPGTTYYQKLCFPTSSVAGCAEIFEEAPQKLLVGQSRQVTDAGSVSDCMQACLSAQARFGFACASAMFFANTPTQNCILNTETQRTRPDVFTSVSPDDSTKSFYLETGCGAGGGPVQPALSATARLRDQSLRAKSSSGTSLWGRTSNGAAAPAQTRDLWGRVRSKRGVDLQEIKESRKIAKNKRDFLPRGWN